MDGLTTSVFPFQTHQSTTPFLSNLLQLTSQFASFHSKNKFSKSELTGQLKEDIKGINNLIIELGTENESNR